MKTNNWVTVIRVSECQPCIQGLMIHISKKHSENKCDICNSMFDTKSELQAHRNINQYKLISKKQKTV